MNAKQRAKNRATAKVLIQARILEAQTRHAAAMYYRVKEEREGAEIEALRRTIFSQVPGDL